MSFKTVRCATYGVSVLGLEWLRRLTRDRQVRIRLLSDVVQTDSRLVRSVTETIFAGGEIDCRTAPARPGPGGTREVVHPKILILDDVMAVVGSVNLTGKGLSLGIQPYNVEMSVGLSGTASQPTIKQLVEIFDRWWEDGQPLRSHLGDEDKKENQHMTQPEYVIFRDRPMWGIAQVQTEVTASLDRNSGSRFQTYRLLIQSIIQHVSRSRGSLSRRSIQNPVIPLRFSLPARVLQQSPTPRSTSGAWRLTGFRLRTVRANSIACPFSNSVTRQVLLSISAGLMYHGRCSLRTRSASAKRSRWDSSWNA